MQQVRRLSTSSIAQRKWIRIHWWPSFKRWQELDKGSREKQMEQAKVKNFYRITDDLYVSPEKSTDVMVKKPLADQCRKDQQNMPLDLLTNHTMLRYVDHSIDNIKRVRRYEKFQVNQYDQRFIAERFLFLGADLAAAHFLVHRGASVKFVGDEHWYKKDKWGNYDLPGRKVDGLYLEAIDASGTELMYEGFDNLYDLKHLRLLRLANCDYIDDWALSRIGGTVGSTLQFLDLSGCKNISHKGLAALRTARNLQFLRLEGLDHVKQLSKTVIMLEELLPRLEVSGVNYDEDLKRLEYEHRLLTDERTVVDAKGNMFVEDDNGELFYVHGKIEERATVNDDDQPIVTSTIRRNLPEMDEVEFERLNQLSNGKLRHLMLGSPSGYMWSDQVERILSHEHKLDKQIDQKTDTKMLPFKERIKRFREINIDPDQLISPLNPEKFLLEREEEYRALESEAMESTEENKKITAEAV